MPSCKRTHFSIAGAKVLLFLELPKLLREKL
jgi:hypothetical protein